MIHDPSRRPDDRAFLDARRPAASQRPTGAHPRIPRVARRDPHAMTNRPSTVLASAVFGAALALPAAALAAPQNYTIVDLSTLAGPYTWFDPGSVATSVSRGAVVGHSVSGQDDRAVHAIRAVNGAITDLGTLPGDQHSMAFASNPAGDAVGISYVAGDVDVHGVLWPWAGGMISLGSIEPHDIAADGAIAGSIPFTGGVAGAAGTMHACLRIGATTTDIGTLGGPSSMGLALNENHWVVGDSMLADNRTTHAFVWRNGAMLDLGTLGGAGSRAVDIDGLTVVGFADILGTRAHAVRWVLNEAGGIVSKTDLGTLGGSVTSAAFAVHGDTVVGSSNDRAVLWNASGIVDLNTLIDAKSYWVLTKAIGIDSAGRIVGVGRHKGLTRAFVMVPQIPADLDGDGIVGAADLAILLGAWGSTDPQLDLNHDGSVNAPDVAILLGAWT